MFDDYLFDLLALKEVVMNTDWQTDWRTDGQTDICLSWAAFAAEKMNVLNYFQAVQTSKYKNPKGDFTLLVDLVFNFLWILIRYTELLLNVW